MTLIVPKFFCINDKIDGFLTQVEKVPTDEQVSLDLGKIEFINPSNLIMLITTSRAIFERTGKKVRWINVSSVVSAYLERINISNVSFIDFKLPPVWERLYRGTRKSNTLIELQTIDDWKGCGDAVKRTKEILLQWFPNQLGRPTNDICSLLSETAENSIDHSSESPGQGYCFYVLQKYHIDGKDQIQIAVGDIGIGIRNSLKRVAPDFVNNDVLAIKRALFQGMSGRTDKSGGLGYIRVREILKQRGGTIQIRSGYGSITYSAHPEQQQTTAHRCSFPGTQTIFTISS
ncbi:MAG: Histidine kinase-, DNA gyrase B-, and HSP90-like ATPase [Pelotomaculum sp. PtaU1.Bin035]|nr:MAG: Histidine kinase-, DNA gyrase B-, and HSP90-like ATPase [Pelotomaculum sp. PtaU1.Bin035]